MSELYVVMPAYNEEANIQKTVKEWYPVLKGKSKDSKLVVADSGSTDMTHEILTKMQAEYPQLEILSNTGKFHGCKVIALYDYAIKSGAQYVFQTDSDGQTAPDEFEKFWRFRGQYAAVIGKRSERGDGRNRAFVEKVVCLLLRAYFGVKVPDANAPFRLMRADLLEKYLYRLPQNYNLPNIMLTAYFVRNHEKVLFQNISFKTRQGGKNSINITKIVKIGWQALGDFRRLKKEM